MTTNRAPIHSLALIFCLLFFAEETFAQSIVLEAEQSVIKLPFAATNEYVSSPVRTTDPQVSGSLTFNFTVAQSGNYIVQLLVDSPTGFDVYSSIDAGSTSKSFFINPGEQTNGFEWRSLYWSETDGSTLFYFGTGAHTLVVFGGTANIKIDKIRIIRMIDLVASQVPIASGLIDGNLVVMGSGLGIENQVRQGCYLNGRSYACYIRPTLDWFDLVVALPARLESKRYYVFVKGSAGAGFQASVGTSSTAKVVPNPQGTWTALGYLEPTQEASYLVITAFRGSTPLTGKELSQVEGVYLTTNPYEIVNGSDIVIEQSPVQTHYLSPVIKDNLIPNGSFEVGLLADVVLADRYDLAQQSAVFTPFSSGWDQSVGYEGSASLKIVPNRAPASAPSTYQIVQTRSYHLKPNKNYTASAMVKASVGQHARVVIRLVNTHDSSVLSEKAYDPVTADWQRISVSGLIGADSDYSLQILVHNSVAPVWIDTLQLEEGELSPYSNSNSVEAAVQIKDPAHLFYEDELIRGDLHVHNFNHNAVTKKVIYEIYDYLNNLLKSSSTTLTLAAGEHKIQTLDLSLGRRGCFRLNSWIEGEAGTEKETIYGVIPRPVVIGSKLNSFMGVHTNISDFQLQTVAKMGIYWLRTLSAADLFRWQFAEPEDGQFVFNDEPIQLIASHETNILGSLNLGKLPPWAIDSNQRPRLDKWSNYVSGIVSHYKNWVKYWEVDNEPNHRYPANFYAQMLKQAIDAIEQADPSAKIVAMGGTDFGYMTSVFNELTALYPGWDWKSHIDVASTHAYPSGTRVLSAKDAIVAPFGLPVWNTETGAWDMGSMVGDFTGFAPYGRQIFQFRDSEVYYRGAIKKPESVVQNFLSSIGGGQTKYFYYDARISDQPYTTQPTFFENDDSIRAKGVAYAIAGSFIDFSTILGEIPLPNLQAYLFEKSNIPVATLWSSDLKNRSLLTSLSASQIRVFDLMGNEISLSSNSIPVGRSPIYVKGVGVSSTLFRAAIAAGTLVDRVDSVAPRVVIVSAPRGPIDSPNVRIRWLGLDETSVPEFGDLDPEQTEPTPGANPNALMYSFRLVGKESNWSNWSAATFIDYQNLAVQSYSFEVRVKDEAGNVSATASRAFTIVPLTGKIPIAAGGLRVQ